MTVGNRPAPRPIPVGLEPPPLDDGPPRPGPASGKGSKPKGKAGERFAVLNAFVDFTLAGLTRAEIAVWLILYRDVRDGTARTAYDDLARRAGVNRRNVGRALRGLERRGLVRAVYRGGLGRGPSRYHLRPLAKDP